jgi:hypothetical protein
MTHSNRLRAYVTTALWSSTGDDDQPLDANYSIDDLAPETLAKMQSDLDKFFTFLESAEETIDPELDSFDVSRGLEYKNPDIFVSLLEATTYYADKACKDFDAEGRICHDFWLTRNRHGCGFWDGSYKDLGDRLTNAAQAFGECDLYVGDDGKIYC